MAEGPDAMGAVGLPPHSSPFNSDLSKVLAHLVHAVQHVAQHLLGEVAAVGQHEAEKLGKFIESIGWKPIMASPSRCMRSFSLGATKPISVSWFAEAPACLKGRSLGGTYQNPMLAH